MLLSDLSREQFASIRAAFRKLANTKQLTPTDIVFHNLIRGLPSNRGFTTITNKTKIENGAEPDAAFAEARINLHNILKHNKQSLNTRFGGTIPDAVIASFTYGGW